MKKILLVLIAIFPLTAYSQIDSTIIFYKGIENNDLRTICDLANIQIQKILCTDSSLRGKVFNVIIKEFKKGRIVTTDNFNISGEDQKIPMVVKGDTLIYIINILEKAGFGRETDSLTMTFAGLLKNNVFKLKINYPGMSIQRELKGKSNYSLRVANSCSENMVKVPVNAEYPILAYTPPFDSGARLQSYCMLTEENVLDWYKKYKVNHYYVIYLEIK